MKDWIYGRNPVYEALRAGRRQAFQLKTAKGVQEKGRLAEILGLCRANRVPVHPVDRAELDRLADNHQGVALEAGAYPYSALETMLARAQASGQPPFFLLLDALKDPQNLGALLRSAEAVGVHGVLLPLRRTATVTPAVVSASSGASEHLHIAQTNLAQAIEALKENDVWVLGLDGGPASQPVEAVDLNGPIAIVVGSEGEGMRRLVQESCDFLVRLPMMGKIESLNAAVAGSVVLYLALAARGSR